MDRPRSSGRRRTTAAAGLLALGLAAVVYGARAQEVPTASRATIAVPAAMAPASRRGDAFLGEPDEPVLRALATENVTATKKGSGGRSLSFKVELSGGRRGYYKPEQTFAANWFSEVAAYHLDRELGLGRAAPVVGRRLSWSLFSAAAGDDPRVRELRIQRGGMLRGALVSWIEGELTPLAPPQGWEHWLRIDPPQGVSPFQRSEDWRRARKPIARAPAPPPDRPGRAAELSDMILFDYLMGNLDRWGGGYTNVRTRGPGGPLVYLDNANGFHAGVISTKHLDAQLAMVQRFRRRTVDAIRAFDVGRFRERLARDPLGLVLDDGQLSAVEARRKRLLQHVAAVERAHGVACMSW